MAEVNRAFASATNNDATSFIRPARGEPNQPNRHESTDETLFTTQSLNPDHFDQLEVLLIYLVGKDMVARYKNQKFESDFSFYEQLHGIQEDTVSEPSRRKENASIYDKHKELTEPTVFNFMLLALSAILSSSASATINITYFMASVRDSNPDEKPDHTGSYQSGETGQLDEQLYGKREDTVSESCRRKENVSIYDKLKEFTEPTVCTEDCKLKIPPETIADYEVAILQLLLCLRTHSQTKNAAIWTRKKKKKSYQKKGPKMPESAKAAAATYCRQFFKDYSPLHTTEPIPEKRMVVMREKEYENVRRHGPAILAMGQQIDKVRRALETDARVDLWENLSLPEERDYALFDSYIPLICLVAQLKYATDRKWNIYWEEKESMDEMDEALEKLYDELPKLLDDLQAKISPESDLYRLLSTRDQFWPSKKFLFDDPIIDELKEVIVEKVGTLNLADKKRIANRHASILFRCKNKMFQNCFKVFYYHGKELEDLINTLLNCKLEEVEPPQAKRKRLDEQCEKKKKMDDLKYGEFEKICDEFPELINVVKGTTSPASHLCHQQDLIEGRSEEEENLSEALSNLKTCSRSVQSTPMLVEDVLEELGMQLSSNLVPLTYEQLEQTLGQDIRPILRDFLMDPTQTVDNTVRELVQLSNNRFIVSRTLDTTVLLVGLRDPIVWRTIIFDWLAERRAYLSAAIAAARMRNNQKGINVKIMKEKIFYDLSLLLAGSDLVSGHGVVRMLFSLCRHANQSSVQVRTYFTADEQTNLDAQLIEAIPYFHRNVREKALMLGEESLMRLRTVRSGIQFLSDDLATTDSPDLYFAVSDFMESLAVFDLDKKLRIFEGMRGQYDCGDDCEDLRGVPASHFWWSELERGDSERKFGK